MNDAKAPAEHRQDGPGLEPKGTAGLTEAQRASLIAAVEAKHTGYDRDEYEEGWNDCVHSVLAILRSQP